MVRRALSAGAAAACTILCFGSGPAWGQTAQPEDAQLRWDEPIVCLITETGERLHAQCNQETKMCLYHNGCFDGTRGERCKRLQKLQGCIGEGDGVARYQELRAAGMRFVKARAESPPGWARDERGRVFQTHFDLNRRLWLGARWHPTFGPSERETPGRVGFETGLRAESLSDDTRTRHRFRVLNGELTVNPLSVDATLFRYESSREFEHPLVRITTFWPPERHDMYVNVGWWSEALGVHFRPRASEDETHLRFAAAGLSTDFWHSADMADYLRLRIGAAFEDLYLDRDDVAHRLAITPLAHLETDVVFDPQGMHRLTVATGYEAPAVWHDDGQSLPTVHHRFLNEVAYELLVLAINDQPVTVRAAAEGGYRDDLLAEASGWAIATSLGLRINLWAPAPDQDDAERIRRLRGR